MKNHSPLVISSLYILFLLVLSACFSPLDRGDAGTIVIKTSGSSGAGRSAAMTWPPSDFLDDIKFELTFTGNEQTIPLTANGGETISVTVTTGLWNVQVNAFYQDRRYAEGNESAVVRAGQINTVHIQMYQILHTVTFEANGGSPIPQFRDDVTDGEWLEPPPSISKDDFNFGGWFRDADCTIPWIFASDTVTGDIALFAKWNEIGYFEVTFDADAGTPQPTSQTVAEGNTAAKPAPDPEKDGFVLVHWFNTANNEEWDFDYDTVTENITLKALWAFIIDQKIQDPGTYQLRHGPDGMLFSANEDYPLVTEKLRIVIETLQLVGGGGDGGRGGDASYSHNGSTIRATSGHSGGGGGAGFSQSVSDVTLSDFSALYVVVGGNAQGSSLVIDGIDTFNAAPGGNANGQSGGIGYRNGSDGANSVTNSRSGSGSVTAGANAGAGKTEGWWIDGKEFGWGGNGGMSGRAAISLDVWNNRHSTSASQGSPGSPGGGGYVHIFGQFIVEALD